MAARDTLTFEDVLQLVDSPGLTGEAAIAALVVALAAVATTRGKSPQKLCGKKMRNIVEEGGIKAEHVITFIDALHAASNRPDELITSSGASRRAPRQKAHPPHACAGQSASKELP